MSYKESDILELQAQIETLNRKTTEFETAAQKFELEKAYLLEELKRMGINTDELEEEIAKLEANLVEYQEQVQSYIKEIEHDLETAEKSSARTKNEIDTTKNNKE